MSTGGNAAAIDIGSNAIRLLIGGMDSDKGLRTLKKVREPIRLGKDVFGNDHLIKSETLDQVTEVFGQFKAMMTQHSVEKCRAVATSALREARNNDDLVARVLADTGIEIEIIDGLQEARLIHGIVAQRMNLGDTMNALIDIGGGSAEVIVSRGSEVLDAESFPLGTVRLLQEINDQSLSFFDLDSYIHKALTPLRSFLNSVKGGEPIQTCLGVGGNVECLGVIRKNLFQKKSTRKVRRSELAYIIEELQQMSYEQRISEWRLRPDRADVLLPASLVILNVIREVNVGCMQIPRLSLKDAILFDLLRGL